MTEFENLIKNYTLTIQLGLASGIGCHEAKHGNELVHKLCENLVESSSYPETEKAMMKHSLALVKEALSKEIDSYYHKGSY